MIRNNTISKSDNGRWSPENFYGIIPVLDKKIDIPGTVEDFNRMIWEACGIRECPIKPLTVQKRTIIDLLFHKKRKALCKQNNSRYRLTRFYL